MLKQRLGHITVVVVVLLTSAVLLISSCAPAAKTAPAVPQKTIKVGLNLVLTGTVASSVAPWSYMALAYLKYVNDELGGIEYTGPDGKKDKVMLDIIWEDNAYSVPKALSIYKRQKERGIMAHYVTSTTPAEPLAEPASRDHIPIMCHGNASPVVLGAQPNYVTVAYPSYADMAATFLEWLKLNWKETRPPKVGFTWVDVPAVRVGANTMVAVMTPEAIKAKYGAELTVHEYPRVMPTDTTVELTRLSNAGTNWVYTTQEIAGAVVLLKDMARLNLKMNVMVSSATFDESVIRLAGAAAEGVYGLALNASPDEDLPGVKLAHKVMRKYYDRDATLLEVQGLYTAVAFVEGLKQALQKTGYAGLTREAINDAFHNLKNVDTGGVTPPITVDPVWPVLNTRLRAAVIKGGKIQPVGDWIQAPVLELQLPK